MPRRLGPRIAAREWEEEGRFRFAIDVALPLVGPVVRYTGWLRWLADPVAPAARSAA